jgi:DNA-binding NarL/FixJ family response regulator
MARRPKSRFADAAGIAAGSSTATGDSFNRARADEDKIIGTGLRQKEAWRSAPKAAAKADRKRKVLEAHAAGHSTKQIERMTGVHIRTVQRYLAEK